MLAAAARGIWVVPVFLGLYWAWITHTAGHAFPVESWFYIAAAVMLLSSALTATKISVWNSWMTAQVPRRFRGRFFGIRERYRMAALIIANLIGAALVEWKPQGYRAGYALLGVFALIVAAVSTLLLWCIPASTAGSVSVPEKNTAVAGDSLLDPFRDIKFRKVLVFGALFNFAIQLAGPFFPYYFTKELNIPMSLVAIWNVVTNIGVLMAAGYLGRQIDRPDGVRRIFRVSVYLIAFSPLPYLVASAAWVKTIAPIEFLINGGAWSGFSLGLVALLFKACPPRRNVVYFAVFAAASGLAGAAASFLGGALAGWLYPWGGFRALWFVAMATRLTVIWSFSPLENNVSAGPDPRGAPPPLPTPR